MNYTFVDDIAQNAKTGRSGSRTYRAWGKRAGDIVAVLLIAPFAVPVVFAAWLLTTPNGSKALYGQPRVGMDGAGVQVLENPHDGHWR